MTEVATTTTTTQVKPTDAIRTSPTEEQPAHRNHYAQFKLYLRRNLRYVQQLVRNSDYHLVDDTRKQALHTLSYALGEPDLWPQIRDLLFALAPKMELAGHREDWLPYLERSCEESERMGDPAMAAECELQIGLTYRLSSDFAAAHDHLLNSVALAVTATEWRTKARALNELAWLEQLQEEFVAAAAHVDQALALLDEDDPERAVCYRVQGMIAFGSHDWQNAEKLHRLAHQIFERQGDRRRAAWSIHNLACVKYGQGNYDAAIHLFQEAEVELHKLDDVYNWSMVQSNLGISYFYSGDVEKAIECYNQAISIAEKLSDKLQIARIYTNYGLACLSIDKFEDAIEYFQRSAALCRALGNLSLTINALDGLAMVYLRMQSYHAARQVIEEALKLLPEIEDAPNFQYLANSLQTHLIEAQQATM